MTKQNERSVIDEELLAMLRCPETLQRLRLAEAAVISDINKNISAGKVKNRGGQPVADALDGGLVREDGQLLYPIRAHLPVMIIEEAIALTTDH